jgi:PAS domain S-box-containing protein
LKDEAERCIESEKREHCRRVMLGRGCLEIVDYIADPVLEIDNNFTVLRVNKAMEELLGLDRKEIVGRKCFTLFHDSEIPPEDCPFLVVQRTGEKEERESQLPLLGDRWFWITVSPVKDADGAVVGAVQTLRDITCHKELQGRLLESERLYRELFEKSAAGIFRVTPGGRFLDANPRLIEILGYSSLDELKRLDIAQNLYVNPEERKQFVNEMETKGGVERYRVWLRRKDGVPVCISVYGTTMRDEHGNTLYYQGTVIDVTERVMARQAAEKVERRYRLLVERAPIGIFQFTREGEIISINPSMARMLGYSSPKELEGVNLYDELCGDAEKAGECRRLLEADGEVFGQEVQVVGKDGNRRWLKLYVYEVRGGNGPFYEGSCIDITQERLLMDQLRHAQRMESIGVLAGGIAHDFNNILMSIQGNVEMAILKSAPDDPTKENLDAVLSSVERASKLVDQILAFSRKQPLNKQLLSIEEYMALFSEHFHRILGEDILLELHLEKGVWGVEADPSAMDQIFLNLVTNARDAMPDGGELLIEAKNFEVDEEFARVHPWAKPGQYVCIAVTDTGCGMSKGVMDRVFDPFFTTKDVGKGTGLGLSTVYGLVKDHGGMIHVYSEEGKGSTFKVYLPALVGIEVQSEDREDKKSIDPPISGEGLILVVEDDSYVRRLMLETLRGLGYQVVGASNGEEGYEKYTRSKKEPDLVITDVVMPRIGGMELYERIKRESPGCRFLFISGYTLNNSRLENHWGEGFHILQKPFSTRELANKVHEIMRGGKR